MTAYPNISDRFIGNQGALDYTITTSFQDIIPTTTYVGDFKTLLIPVRFTGVDCGVHIEIRWFNYSGNVVHQQQLTHYSETAIAANDTIYAFPIRSQFVRIRVRGILNTGSISGFNCNPMLSMAEGLPFTMPAGISSVGADQPMLYAANGALTAGTSQSAKYNHIGPIGIMWFRGNAGLMTMVLEQLQPDGNWYVVWIADNTGVPAAQDQTITAVMGAVGFWLRLRWVNNVAINTTQMHVTPILHR